MATSQESCEETSVLTKKIKVKVLMDKDGPCWNYALEADDNASDPYVKAGNKIDMGSGPGSGAEIEFRLQGKAGNQLEFDTTDPIWIQVTSCPTSGTGGLPTGFSFVSCSANKLVIGDENLGPQADYHYRLNFIDSSTGQPLSWDPIIRNGGGGP